MSFTLPWPGQPATGSAPVSQVVRENLTAIASFLNAIDGAGIQAGTIQAAAMAASINPITRQSEVGSNFISSGFLPGGYAGLALTIPGGTAYVSGFRVAGLSKGFTVAISQDTYFDIDTLGNFYMNGVANGATVPTLLANRTRLFKAISNGTAITSIVDLRILGPISTDTIQNPYKFCVSRNAAWTDGVNTSVLVAFDAKVFDTGNNVDIVTNKGRFTVPVTGFYFISATVGTSVTASSVHLLLLYKNGGEIMRGTQGAAGPITNQCQDVFANLILLTSGDYLEMWHYGTGGAGNVGLNQTNFSGFLVSRT